MVLEVDGLPDEKNDSAPEVNNERQVSKFDDATA